MAIKENDFIEIEFTGRIKDTGEVFDTNVESDAKASNLDVKNIKPFVMSVGHKMLPGGFDKDLVGKEVGNKYTLELKSEDAFGKRNSQLVRMIPTKMFHEQQINPQRGMQLSLDGQLVKILSSDRGRTLVDFNNPLAGKVVVYDYKVNRMVEDKRERVDALQEFLFRKKFDFDLKDDGVLFKIEKEVEPMIRMFAPKFEEILGIKIESEIVEKKNDEKKTSED
jgi:FKBP-type peptidyl-prolyl cis-trans isomerase 2